MNMLRGDQETKQNFLMQSKTQAHLLFSQFIRDEPQVKVLVEIVGEELVTGWQIHDVLDTTRDFEQIKKKLIFISNQNELIKQGEPYPEIEVEDEKDKDKDKKKPLPHSDVPKLLTDLGFGDFVPKLKEHDIENAELFFELEIDAIIGLLEIKTEGKKFRFKQKLQQVKDDHEKRLAELEEEKQRKMLGGYAESFELLQKRSTLTF